MERRMLGRHTVSLAIPDTTVEISDERKAEARKNLITFGLDPTKTVIALGVGSTNSRAKRWPAERYAELNDRLQTDLNANVILIGSKAETDVADRVAALCIKPPINLAGKTDLA